MMTLGFNFLNASIFFFHLKLRFYYLVLVAFSSIRLEQLITQTE